MAIIYNISINQLAVVENGWDLDFSDMAIFDCFHIFGASPRTQRITTMSGQWFWLSTKKVIEELPLLGIGDKQVKRRIAKLIECGLLEKCPDDTSREYYRFGDNYPLLFVKEQDKNVYTQTKMSTPPTKMSGDADKNVHDSRTKMSTEDYINNNIIQENIIQDNIPPIIPPRGESPRERKAGKTDFKGMADDFAAKIPEDDWRELVTQWLDYKIAIKHPLRCQTSLAAFLKTLRRDSGGDIAKAREFLETAMANGWQGYHKDARKSAYEQRKDYEREKAAESDRKWREYQAEREKRDREDAERREREQAEYERKVAEWRENERRRKAAEDAAAAERERQRLEDDLPF